jgi:hypothetical protein
MERVNEELGNANVLRCGIAILPSLVAARQQPTIVHPISPAIPLFRCGGQRLPTFGAENCANWRLMKKQEQLIDLRSKTWSADIGPPPVIEMYRGTRGERGIY